MNNIRRLILLASLVLTGIQPARALVINITYDATVTNLMNPAQVQPAVAAVVQWLQNQYTNPITINITVPSVPASVSGKVSSVCWARPTRR